MISTKTALLYTVILGTVIFLCRFLPFVLFRENTKNKQLGKEQRQNKFKSFLEFVEATVPAVAMTVLAVNALSVEVKELLTPAQGAVGDIARIIPLGVSALVTVVLHIWKRNALVSIFGGTILYMLLLNINF
jgi:branched-subunit amino acid transport protein AzlD